MLFVLPQLAVCYLQAQEHPQNLDVIYRSDSVYVITVRSIDENTFLAFGGTHAGRRTIMKTTYDGEILDSIGLPVPRMEDWRHGNFMNGKFRYVSYRQEDNDTLPLLCVVDVDPEDLSLTYRSYNWDGLDFNHPTTTFGYRNQIYSVFSKDGSLTLSYPVDSLWMINGKEAIHLVKFDVDGNVIRERVINNLTSTLTNFFFSAPDSLGTRIVLMNPHHYAYDCYSLDSELNTDTIFEDVGLVYYSGQNFSGWFNTFSESSSFVRFNPYNLRTYSLGSECPFGKKTEMDVIMGVFDEDFNHLNWTWGIINPEGNDEGFGMCFGEQGEIYMLGWMDIRTSPKPENMYVGFMDGDLNKLSEIYYKPDNYYLGPLDIATCPTGGCIVCSNRLEISSDHADYCIFRITPEDFLNVGEAHSHGFAVATGYPNPGGNTLNIRTALPNARLEVCDFNGRLVHSQVITENVTEIDARGWASGTYIWKVYTDGHSTSSGTLAESGKWIKE